MYLRPFALVIGTVVAGTAFPSEQDFVQPLDISSTLSSVESLFVPLTRRFPEESAERVRNFLEAYDYLLAKASSETELAAVMDSLHKADQADSLDAAIASNTQYDLVDLMDRLRVKRVSEESLARLRHLVAQAASEPGPNIRLVTQADLLFVLLEQRFVSVPVDQRLRLIQAIEEVVSSTIGSRNQEVYAIAGILNGFRRRVERSNSNLNVLLVLLHIDLSVWGRGVLQNPGVMNSDNDRLSWCYLLEGLKHFGSSRVGMQDVVKMNAMDSAERTAFGDLVNKAATVRESLSAELGVSVDDFFIITEPNRLLDFFGEKSRESRLQEYAEWSSLVDSEEEKNKVRRRVAMFARWPEITPVREMYGDEFRSATKGSDRSWIVGWERVDSYIESVSLGQVSRPVLPRSVTDRFVRRFSSDGSRTNFGTLLEDLVPPPAGSVTEVIRAPEGGRLGFALETLSRRDVKLSDLVRGGIARLKTELLPHTKEALISMIEEGSRDGPLAFAYRFGMMTGGKLLEDASLTIPALGGEVSEERVLKLRVILSLWLNLPYNFSSSLLGYLERYLSAPERTEEEIDAFTRAMKLLVISCKAYEVRTDALSECPDLGYLMEAIDTPIDVVVNRINAGVSLDVFEREHTRLPEEIARRTRDYSVMGVLESVIAKTNTVYRNSLWPARKRLWSLLNPAQVDYIADIASIPHLVHHAVTTLSGTTSELIKTVAMDILEAVELVAKTPITTEDAEEFTGVIEGFNSTVMYPQPGSDVVESLKTLRGRMERIVANWRSPGRAQAIQASKEAIISEFQRLGNLLEHVTLRPEEDAELHRIGEAFHQATQLPERGQDVVATLEALRHDTQQVIANIRARRAFIL